MDMRLKTKRSCKYIIFLFIMAVVAVFLPWKSIEVYVSPYIQPKDAEKQKFAERQLPIGAEQTPDVAWDILPLGTHKHSPVLAGIPQSEKVLTAKSKKASVTMSSNPSTIAIAFIKSQNVTSHATADEALPKAQPQPIPFMGNYDNCSDLLCSEFLTEEDKERFQKCNGKHTIEKVKCHFMDGTDRSPVALASYPGSGNTWVRGLLEKATGICTGSVYCDSLLKIKGMHGERLHGGSVLVTKTHSMRPMKWGSILTTENKYGVEITDYGATILLVRNPFDAVVSYHKWLKSGSHTKDVEIPLNDGYVRSSVRWWKGMFIAWIEANTHNKPVLVVKYEDLKSNKMVAVKHMLEFLGVPYSEEELQKRLVEDYKEFHRSHSTNDFNPFTPEQRDIVCNAIQETLNLLQEKNNGETFGIEGYLEVYDFDKSIDSL